MSLTILISSAGRRVELIQCFRADAKALGVGLRVIACDQNPEWSSACACADLVVEVPRCDAKDFVTRMLELCKKEGVRLVVPTIDTELQIFTENRISFEAIGVSVAVSSSEVVRVARDKALSAEFLSRGGVPVPRTALLQDLVTDAKGWRWPVMLKPVGGSGSVGVKVVRDLEEVRAAAQERTDYIAQELWRGVEYTVNVFFDRDGKLRSAVPHQRLEVRAGEVSKGVTRRDPMLIEIAERIGQMLKGAYGALCFQAIVTESGEAAVFEINARFGGGYPLAHRAGATFSKWLLEDALGLPSTAHGDWKDGVVMLRYDAAVFRESS